MFCRRCAGSLIPFLLPLSSFLLLLSAFLLPLFFFPSSLHAQLEPPSTGGIVALDQELRMLGHYKRVLMIGAHPDDEDTELLTILVRGEGAEAAYLSLNRGEGGQNLIGPELGEALGLLRTEELLAARRLDGARQYFTRAYDFGYSKSLDETWQHWPKDSILKDVVRIVRRFRPQIVVSIFSGTPRDGHGQHQAAGWAAINAFRVAGDSTRFPELRTQERLEPWTPLKLYRSTRFDTSATTLTLDGGELDPAVGKSFHQIAMAGRSLHRSQDMGQLQTIGPSTVRLQLMEDRTGNGSGALWAGVDTTFQHLSDLTQLQLSRNDLTRALVQIDSARARYLPARPWEITDYLRRAADAITRQNTRQCGQEDCDFPVGAEITEVLDRLHSAAAAAQGLVLDATADDERVVPGQTLRVRLTLWNASARPVDGAVGLNPAPGSTPRTSLVMAGDLLRTDAEVPIRRDAVPSAPYFLRHPRVGDLYSWKDADPWTRGEPFDPPAFLAWGADGAGIFESREVVHRFNDQARGEVRRSITIVPRVDVKLEPAVLVWPAGSTTPRRFTATLTHGARDTTTGILRLELPAGWPAVAPQPFRLTREDEIEVFTFSVRAPAARKTASIILRAVARDSAGTDYDTGVFTIDYPHIRPRSWTGPAVATINAAPLALPQLTRVGYVRGAADRVPEALRSVGVPIELLDGAALERGKLARYDAIVVGPRAYETDPELVANNRRLLEYVRAGGLVIVQYQQYQFFTGGFAPYPLTVGGQPLQLAADSDPRTPPQGGSPPNGSAPPPRIDRHDRVTDETAPVRIVDPRSPVVLRPNRIGPTDWDGWVQERGLYFARTWDPRYRTVLETHDPGEGPLEGGLLVATVGKGTYVYTGLAFFRQLPAGVPGAFRLFANLLALRPAGPVH